MNDFQVVECYEELQMKAKKYGLYVHIANGKMSVEINGVPIGAYSSMEGALEAVTIIGIFIENNKYIGKHTCLIVPKNKQEMAVPYNSTDLVLEVDGDEINVIKDRSGQLKRGTYTRVGKLESENA